MRNSNLLKWAQNMNNKSGKDAENRNWIHPPEALSRGHIAYLVKFLGNLEVDQPKGIEVVKEGIRKLKFNQQHIRKSEGSKLPKVELTISVDGVAIQEPKTKRIMHQYPLHRISYCADDKAERRFFSFIVKESPDSEQHMCFVFLSDKLAEDITLTIGQAFDLAYKRFLEMEVQRRLMVLQQRVNQLESENSQLKRRLTDLATGDTDVATYMRVHNLTDLTYVEPPPPSAAAAVTQNGNAESPASGVAAAGNAAILSNSNRSSSNGNSGSSSAVNNSNGMTSLLLNLNDTPTTTPTHSSASLSNGGMSSSSLFPPIPPRSFHDDLLSDLGLTGGSSGGAPPTVGRKLEGLLLDELMEDDFDPRAHESAATGGTLLTRPTPPPLLAPPPSQSRRTGHPPSTPLAGLSEDVFGLTPFNDKGSGQGSADPFGMGDFAMGSVPNSVAPGGPGSKDHQQDLESAIGLLDQRILEMKDGFSRGLSIGTEDFSIESLDPLRK
uniref:PTB domain-containing adapter protein ced-6 n=1 Tax=Cacopsylla melanoneura TaxID=428564 RepID=A0A8D8V1Q2_9HEMI